MLFVHPSQSKETKFVKLVSCIFRLGCYYKSRKPEISNRFQRSSNRANHIVNRRGHNMGFTDAQVKIFRSTIEVFNKYGLKLTVDQIAKNAGISKKTVYRDFDGKEDLFLKLVDYLWDNIKTEEEEALKEEGLPTLVRLRKLLSAMPSWYSTINLSELSELRELYPEVYKKVQMRLETGWEPTIELIKKGQDEGVIRKDIDINIVKMMMDASLERFFEEDILERNNIRYEEGLNKVVDILLLGISAK